MSDEDLQSELVLELAEEFLARYRKGERPPLREYIQRHPELASEIKEVFPAMAMMENIAVADESLEAGSQALGVGGQTKLALEQLGDYRIIRTIGQGGMGVVYEAEQISLGRHVALKVLPHKALADAKTRRRFEREAKAAAKLHHTNIVPVFGIGEHEGLPYYVMQFIQGLSMDLVLEELKRLKASGDDMEQVASLPMSNPYVSKGPTRAVSGADMARSMLTGEFQPALSPLPENDEPFAAVANPAGASAAKSTSSASVATLFNSSGSIALPGQSGTVRAPQAKRRTYWYSVAQTGVQVAQALDYAHKQGIIHRDIKPSNLLLDISGTVWVTDFGLAKADDQQGLTRAGDLLGTLRYMPPEAFDGKTDGRADIYSLGLTLYELLAFRPAFDEKDRNRLVKRVTTEEPARLDRVNRDVPRDLVTIVHKAIARDPKHRYQTPAEMADDLRRFGEDRPVRARRVSEAERIWRWCRRNPLPASLLVGIVLVFMIGFAGVFWQWRVAETAREQEQRQRQQAEISRQGAESARVDAERARVASEKSRVAAEAEAYRALLSEVRALRAGHEPGWRDKALADLARLVVMPTPRRDLAEIRTEAAATLATPDIRPVGTIEVPAGDLGSFIFSADGQTLLTVGGQSGLSFWDLVQNRCLSSVTGLTVNAFDLDKLLYLPDGNGIVVATQDQGVVFTDANGDRTARAALTQAIGRPKKIALSGNGQRLAVAWTDGAGITVHDVASGAVLERFNEAGAPFAISPDGKWLARSENADIVLLPIASKEPRIVLGRRGGVVALSFRPDGAALAAAFQDHSTVLWDLARREQVGTLWGHRELVFDVAFSPDGEWIATGSLDYTVRIWETRTGQNVATLTGKGPGRKVQWSPTGEYLATSTNNAKQVFLYKVTGRRQVRQWLTGHRRELLCVAAHPREERLATSGYTELTSWDLSKQRPTPIAFEPNPGAVTALAYSSDGAQLAVSSWPQNAKPCDVEIRDSSTGKCRSRFAGPDIFQALAFDPSGQRLAGGDIAGNVVLWDLTAGRPIQKFATRSAVRSLVFLDPPRKLLANGKNAVQLFNLESGEQEREVEVAGGDIRKFVADATCSRLLVGLSSGAIASLSLPDLAPGPRLEKAHKGSVECLALSPDGRLLATAGADHRVVLHDAHKLEPLLAFPVWAGELRDLTFDFKGRRLAIVGTESDVNLWEVDALHDGLRDLGLAWDRPAAPAPGLDSDAEPSNTVLRPAPVRASAP